MEDSGNIQLASAADHSGGKSQTTSPDEEEESEDEASENKAPSKRDKYKYLIFVYFGVMALALAGLFLRRKNKINEYSL